MGIDQEDVEMDIFKNKVIQEIIKTAEELGAHPIEVRAYALESQLETIREILLEQDKECLGKNGNGIIEWSLRDEVVDSISKLLEMSPEGYMEEWRGNFEEGL